MVHRVILTLVLTAACGVALLAQASKLISGGTLPASCSTGAVYIKTGASQGWYICRSAAWVGPFQESAIAPILAGTTPSIGGGALAAGACASDTVTIAGATTSMAVASAPVTYPGDGVVWHGYVSAADTVTVKVCVVVSLTPTASTYRVRVVP